MKPVLIAALAAATFISSALCQVVIPPHASTYNGFSRGFNFTAAANMILQDVELPLDAYQAGDEAAYLIRINGNVAYYSRGNVPTAANPGARTSVGSLLVSTGDVVDVIGNWSPATGQTNFTAHNSYGSTAPYATTIVGTPHTLMRNGWQWDIGDPAWVSTGTTGTFLAATSGSIGRVLLYAVPPSGLFPSFTATPTSVALNAPVNFSDTSYSSDPGGILAWAWDVDGDSVVDYTTQNCSHSYATEGRYDVTLTVVDATHGSMSQTIPQYIAVDEVQASFTTQLLPGGVAVFTDTSVGNPTSWAWDVDGDSVVDYTTQSTAHVYPGPGQYTVTLTVSDAISNSSTTTSVGIDIIPVPGFGNTYSSATSTRGLWFQAPTKFSIVSASVPDETNNGTQNVLIYRMASAPPAYPATAMGGLEFSAIGVPSTTPTPCVLSFDAGEYVGVIAACGTTTMLTSYATPAGPFSSSVLGVPTTLTRFGTQFNIATSPSPNTLPYWEEPAGAIGRVVLGVTSCAGVPYGAGTPSGAGPDAPKMRCTALPFLGQTTVLSVEQGDASVIGFMVTGLGRANVPSPYGTILIGNILANQIITPGVAGPGTYSYSWNVPNNPALIGIDVNFQYAQILVPSVAVALSNAVELQFAQ